MSENLETPRSLPLREAGSCGCGEHDADIPELNASAIPHALRHGAIHGALNTRGVGQALILRAPHNPLPLLAEIEARPESFEISYVEQGPEAWRLLIKRVA